MKLRADRIPGPICSLICLLFLLAPQTAAKANFGSPGIGAIVDSPLVLLGDLTGESKNHFIVAFHTPNETTRVVVVRHHPLGLREVDDIELPPDALTLVFESGSWVMRLEAELPTYGKASLRLSTPFGFGTLDGGCTVQGEVMSPSRGLTWFGYVSGSVGGDPVRSWSCSIWGTDASGYYNVIPVGT